MSKNSLDEPSEYDFRGGKRGAVLSNRGKTRITMYVDDEVLAAFRTTAEHQGCGYQTLMNDVLRASSIDGSLTLEGRLRAIVREELRALSPVESPR